MNADSSRREVEAQRMIRDQQAEEYVDRYRQRGPTFVEIDDRVMLGFPGFSPHQDVLDAGCGVGYFTVRVAPRVAKVVACDFSSASLEVLRKELSRRSQGNVESILANLEEPLPLPDRAFHRVISYQVLSYLSPSGLNNALEEFHRVLRPGGELYFTLLKLGWRGHFRHQKVDDAGPFPRYGYRIADMEEVLAASSFEDWEIRGFVSSPARLRLLGDRLAVVRPLIVAADVFLSRFTLSRYTGSWLWVRCRRPD